LKILNSDFNCMKRKYKLSRKQNGVALLVFMLIVAMVTVACVYSKYNNSMLSIDRDKKTSIALQKAKEALIYYSLNNGYLNPSSTCLSNTNCSRPGDLPCPDINNTGKAGLACGNVVGNNQASRLNRLPWKTLGLEDLSDGYGERLWYAVSNNYKYNTRTRPLNSDTIGTITIRDASGKVLYDATTGGGVVAVIFSAGNVITRQDGYVQNRNIAGENTANNYLDIAKGEDNGVFADSSLDGFIMGPVKDSQGNIILNDRLVVITRDEMAAAMESYVLTQVRSELLSYYNTKFYYPYPAAFSDSTCIVSTGANISSGCNSDSSKYEGRIPVSNIDQSGSSWMSTSNLKGLRASNWFQQNLWRELIVYAIAPDCRIDKPNCSGTTQLLTLDNALTFPLDNKQVVILSAGKVIAAQSRASKTSEINYLEGENASPLDFVYSRSLTINNTFNDRAMSIP
jgi:Tfp pilus assembly protein PilE